MVALIFLFPNRMESRPYIDWCETFLPSCKIIQVANGKEAYLAVDSNQPCIVITASSIPHDQGETKTQGVESLAHAVKNNPKVKMILADTDFWEIDESLFDYCSKTSDKDSYVLVLEKIKEYKGELEN